MQRAVGVPTTVVEAIQGLVVIFVAASVAFRYESSYLAAAWRRRKVMDAALAAERQEAAQEKVAQEKQKKAKPP
jgi:simple sugar transport system permease protein